MKYFSTTTYGITIPEPLLKTWNWKQEKGGFRVVVKAKSFAEANRKTEEWLGLKLFSKDFTKTTGNQAQVNACDEMEGIIFQDKDYQHENIRSLVELGEHKKIARKETEEAKSEKKDYVSTWSEAIRNHKTKVKRYFKKEDVERKTPFHFDGLRKDFATGEKLVCFHTKKGWDNDIDTYPSYVLPLESFLALFEEVEIEI